MFFGNFSQIFYVKTSKAKPWYMPLIFSMSGPWNWITSFKSISGANGWILGWMNPRWVSMDGTLIWINYNEQNPGQSPTDWNPFLTQLWMNLSWVDNRIDPSIHPSCCAIAVGFTLTVLHSTWKLVLLSEQQRDVHKGTKGSRANLLLKGCYMKESTIVITKLCFFPFGKEPLWLSHLKKIIGILDVP